MSVSIHLGDVFLLPIPNLSNNHAFIIITAFNLHTGSCIGVPIDTCRGKRVDDRTVVFQPNCHPFITKQSYVNYEKAVVLSIEDLDQNDVRKMDPLTSDLVAMVLEGMSRSKRVKKGIYEIYINFPR